jgi:hypothetical protein
MEQERTCLFMSGPAGATVHVDPVKWWLAISRDVLVNDARRRGRTRPQVKCRRTPTFSRAR